MTTTTREIDVLILVEHVARELDIACAMRQLGRARHGLDIEVASLVFDVEKTLRTYRPRVIASPYFYGCGDFGIRDFLGVHEDVTWVNLAFEQILFKLNRRPKRPSDAIARHKIIHLVAGDFWGSELIESGVPPEHVQGVGSLPCAQYVEPYRRYFEVAKDEMGRRHGLDPTKPWIFFPENFAAAFFSDKLIGEKIADGFDGDELRIYCNYARSSMEDTMPWCWEAARRLDIELIIRPRPANPGQTFIAEAERIAGAPPPPNLHFIKGGGVREWILACELVASNNSTTLIEAAVAGTSVFLLVPSPRPDVIDAPFFDLLPPITSLAKFIDTIDGLRGRPIPEEISSAARKNLLAYGDPFENVVDVFAAIGQGRRSAPAVSRDALIGAGFTPRSVPSPPSPWRRTIDFVGSRLGRGAHGSPHEADAFSQDTIGERTTRWASVLGDS